MCGLVGFYSATLANDPEIQLFKNLLVVDQIRGMHATGVAKVKTKENAVSYCKMAEDAVTFLNTQAAKDFLDTDRANIYIGHNRYATVGDKADHNNAHPFTQDHITLVHNGGVDSWGMDLLEGDDDPNVVVDSHMVTMTIAKHGIKKAVEEHLSGAFALVWWDSKERSLNFIRNSDRPLYMAVTTSGNLVWASEKNMLDVFLDRPGKTSGYRVQPTLIETDTLHTFCFNEHGYRIGTAPTLTKMKFLELPIPKQLAAWFGYNQDNTYSTSGSYHGNSNANYGARASAEDRVNTLLINRGLPLRYKQVLTVDIERTEAYATNPGYGRVFGIERSTKKVVEAWGVDLKAIEPLKVLRMSLADAYTVHRHGNAELVISCDDVHISCFDAAYDQKKSMRIGRQSDSMNSNPSQTTSRSNVTNLRPTVHYPLKVHGHTFPHSVEFCDFVSQGCCMCGNIPSPYDRRNHSMVVRQTAKFTGLLEECEFLCGECGEEA
ncbi:putative glutamine amidotransferase [Pseudomonas phage BroderSalsa]|nr:putative glutamine amidotransferase [Pseudomonas phage BroderSalsa]